MLKISRILCRIFEQDEKRGDRVVLIEYHVSTIVIKISPMAIIH